MSKHKPTCRCVECEAEITLRCNVGYAGVYRATIRRLLREYRKSMRLLEHYYLCHDFMPSVQDATEFNAKVKNLVAKWRKGGGR